MLGYLPERQAIFSFAATEDGYWGSMSPSEQGNKYKQCANYANQQVCNWMLSAEDPLDLCASCRLTKVIPSLSKSENHLLWQRLEAAKRRLLYSLWSLNLRLPGNDDAGHDESGMAFEFKEDDEAEGKVFTGHMNGLITINIAEADPILRETARVNMREHYRTLLGHFRHESGHFYFDQLIAESKWIDGFRELFGDERQDYGEALDNYYANGPAANWEERFISAYASSHPHEDWAETWEHYLHMTDALDTAQACGVSLTPNPALEEQTAIDELSLSNDTFDAIVANWFSLTYVLNSLSRSVGVPDSYPFKLSTPVQQKLHFIHKLVKAQATSKGAAPDLTPNIDAEHVARSTTPATRLVQ